MASLPAESARAARALSAAILLSTIGAAIAGLGLGVLAAVFLKPVGVPMLVIGLAAHLVGMMGRRRVQSAQHYHRAWWEQVAFWGCWVAIAGLVIFAALSAL